MTVSQGQQPLSYEKYLALLKSAAAIFDRASKKGKTQNVNQAQSSTGGSANGGRGGRGNNQGRGKGRGDNNARRGLQQNQQNNTQDFKPIFLPPAISQLLTPEERKAIHEHKKATSKGI